MVIKLKYSTTHFVLIIFMIKVQNLLTLLDCIFWKIHFMYLYVYNDSPMLTFFEIEYCSKRLIKITTTVIR